MFSVKFFSQLQSCWFSRKMNSFHTFFKIFVGEKGMVVIICIIALCFSWKTRTSEQMTQINRLICMRAGRKRCLHPITMSLRMIINLPQSIVITSWEIFSKNALLDETSQRMIAFLCILIWRFRNNGRHSTGIYLFKGNNANTKTMCEMCSKFNNKDTRTTSLTSCWCLVFL